MKNKLPGFLALLLSVVTTGLFAAAKPGEIHLLSSELTPVGAERAGNAAGTIPQWRGGITQPPGDYQPGDHHQDPFQGEMPLLRIDHGNSHESAGLISISPMDFSVCPFMSNGTVSHCTPEAVRTRFRFTKPFFPSWTVSRKTKTSECRIL